MSIFFIVLIILIFFIAFGLSVFYLLIKHKRITLIICSIFILIGFGIYTASYLSLGEGFAHTFLAALRGIFSTARMFIMSTDYSVIESAQGVQWAIGNIGVQILFWISHVAAAIVIQNALLSVFGRRIIELFRLRHGLHKEVYVIKGGDKNALMLGEDIAIQNETKGSKANCLRGELSTEDIAIRDKSKYSVNPERLVLFLVEEEDDAKTISEKAAHFEGIVKTLNRKNDIRYYLDKAGLGRWRLRKKKYHIVLMPHSSSVPDDTGLIAEYAKGKAEKKKISKENLNMDLYVFASSEWDRKRIESLTQNEKITYPCNFHIISETGLLVGQIIEKYPPFRCKGLEFKKGVAERHFNVMILGFGEMGQQALLRLIMNGQFVTKDKSLMHAVVVDRDIKREYLSDQFLKRYPALGLCCDIEFTDFNARDYKLCEQLLTKSSNMDYIVVTLSSNQENKDVAEAIQQHCKEKGLDPPVIAVSEKNEGRHRLECDQLFTFGCREEIYKDAIIIREEKSRMAKAVHKVYDESHLWNELDWFRQESSRAVADFIPAMLKLAGLSEEEAESRSSLTDDTELGEVLAEVLAETEHLRWNAFHAVMGYRSITKDEMKQRFCFGSHGGVSNPLDYARRDSKDRLHACLAPWDKLGEISEAYRVLAQCLARCPYKIDENWRSKAIKQQEHDFADNDRNIVQKIPEFLRAAKERDGQHKGKNKRDG